MRLPKIVRFYLHRSRFIKMMVSFDILEKERILNSYFSGKFKEYESIMLNTSLGKYIRFSIDVESYKSDESFWEFENIASNLCKRLGYELLTGWAGYGSKYGHYSYSVHPSGLTYEVKNAVNEAFSNNVYNQHMEDYYDINCKNKKKN